MTTRQAAELVTEMTPDDRADVLEELEEETRRRDSLGDPRSRAREETEKLLAYEPDTAGGLMTTEFVSVSGRHAGGGSARRACGGSRAAERREAMNAIYATDPRRVA